MAIYGGIGWLVGRWLGNASVGLAVGSLIGVVLALILVNVRLNQTGTNRTAPTQTSTFVQTQEDRAPMREVEANDER
jgi:F0F1-type ATP synthase assembly protein I